MRREIKAYIEAELREYYQTRQDLEDAKEDIRNEGYAVSIDDVGGSYGNKINRPTEKKTLKILTNKRIKRMEQVVRAVEIVINELDEPKMRLVELKYWQRPRRLTDAGIAQEIGCDKSTVWRWANGILLAIAIELGLENETCNKLAVFRG